MDCFIPRSGGQGNHLAGREDGDCGILRAHSPEQSGGHGRSALAVQRRRKLRISGAGWFRNLYAFGRDGHVSAQDRQYQGREKGRNGDKFRGCVPAEYGY